jgi:hypothetical protein
MYFIREVLGGKTIVKPEGESTMYIPFDEGNADYQKYLAWVAEGNVAQEWNPQEAQ